MLFGANTTKPDIHIQRFVASHVGHRVSDIQVLKLPEDAATKAEVSLRDLDATVWETSARGNWADCCRPQFNDRNPGPMLDSAGADKLAGHPQKSCSLESAEIDPAHRTLRLRAEIAKSN
jgi:hypothetical protein